MNAIEIERKARLLEARARSKVNTLFAGEYQSAFKGSGMEVEELRNYAVGDEVRFIDWNVSARTGELHVKSFREERDLTVLLALDVSASLDFGPAGATKQDLVREVAAVLAFASFRKNDRVGLLLFSDSVELWLPPAKGEAARARIFRTLAEFEPASPKTDLACLTRYLSRVLSRRAVIFLFSDFCTQDVARSLATLAAAHDLVPLRVQAEAEGKLPSSGFTLVRDPETGEQMLWDTADRKGREGFAARADAWEAELQATFRSRKLDAIKLVTGRDYLPELVRFFDTRDAHYGSH